MVRTLAALLLLGGCAGKAPGDGGALPDPIDPYLPALPPAGGAALAVAGHLTDENFARERVPGPASQGLPGDFFLRNDRLRVILQAPGRALGPCPYGGTVID